MLSWKLMYKRCLKRREAAPTSEPCPRMEPWTPPEGSRVALQWASLLWQCWERQAQGQRRWPALPPTSTDPEDTDPEYLPRRGRGPMQERLVCPHLLELRGAWGVPHCLRCGPRLQHLSRVASSGGMSRSSCP